MDWVALIALVLKAVVGVSNFLSSRQLLDAGRAEIINKELNQVIDNLKRAKNVSTEVTNNPTGDFSNSVRNKYTRDD